MTRKAWITGAGKGLGRAVVVRLLQSGWTVAVSARTESDLVTLAADAGALDQSVVPFAVDVTDEGAMMATAAAIEARIGPLDLVIFNAGTHEPVRASEFAVAPFRKLFETNVMGVVHGLAAVLPRFIARRSGHVVVVSSVAGYRGLVTGAAYGATKAALTNMCEALKPELDRHGVRITVVSPGFIRTPLTDKNPFKMPFLMEPDDAAARFVRALDSGRFEITFPRRFTWFLKVLRCVPYALYFPLVRNLDKD
jgi:NAD(P)-dependent dehydrogenase (short-subunit alcohol dehydrogenase family)